MKIKNRIQLGQRLAREYGLSSSPNYGTVTLALPYAGVIRIRFGGLPDVFGLSVRLDGHP